MPEQDKSTTKYTSEIDALKETLKVRQDIAKVSKDAETEAKKFAEEIERASKQANESLLEMSNAEIKLEEQVSKNRLDDLKSYLTLLEMRAGLEQKPYAKIAEKEGLPYELPSEEYIKQHEEITRNLSKKLFDITETAAQAMEQNFGTFFFDVMQGNFDSLGDAAKGMLNRDRAASGSASPTP